jgi:hypothetical protein
MGLSIREAAHVRVTCDGCQTATAEVCGKRNPTTMAREAAVTKFKAVGWHHDPGRHHGSARAENDAESSGSGR